MIQRAEILKEIADRLTALKLSVCTAESCTGGLLAGKLTSLSGASTYYLSGMVSYSDEIKAQWLGVGPETLERYSATSAEVAGEMALCIRKRMNASIGLSTTGLAGPGGNPDGKLPVGTVFIGLSDHQDTQVKRYLFEGDREAVRTAAVEAALDLLLQYLRDLDR